MIHERGVNKDANSKLKLRKHPGASSVDILDHIKPILRRQPDKIIVHAGTNDISKGINYLKNVKRIVKLVRESANDITLCFSSIICRTDIEEANEKIDETNEHLKNYCKQQNIGFIDNKNLVTSNW